MADRSKQKKNAKDNLLHAVEFTKEENSSGVNFIDGWVNEEAQPSDEIRAAANTVWALNVFKEHYLSELSYDSSQQTLGRTRESRAVVAELGRRVDEATAKLRELKGELEDEEVARINALVEQTGKEIIEKLEL